jgi:hypothetical protein
MLDATYRRRCIVGVGLCELGDDDDSVATLVVLLLVPQAFLQGGGYECMSEGVPGGGRTCAEGWFCPCRNACSNKIWHSNHDSRLSVAYQQVPVQAVLPLPEQPLEL